MNLRKFLQSRKEADKASEALLASMTELQERLARQLEDLVAGLDTQDGRILPTRYNSERIAAIMAILKQQFSSEAWLKAVSDYLDTFDDITDSVLEYGLSVGEVDGSLLSPIRRQYKALVAGYLTTATSFSADVWIPLYQQISGALVNSAPIDEALKGARELLLGSGEGETGAIAGRASTTVNDLTSIFERTQTQVIAEELEAQFFLYQGSEIDTTREFCAERHGRVWHKTEIEGWASLEWAGKIPETTEATIFTLLGGYQCRHILLPLDVSSVPAIDLARMREGGLLGE